MYSPFFDRRQLKAERMRRNDAESARRTVEAELSIQRTEGARLAQHTADLLRELERARVDLAAARDAYASAQEQGRAELEAVRKEHTDELAMQREQHAK